MNTVIIPQPAAETVVRNLAFPLSKSAMEGQ